MGASSGCACASQRGLFRHRVTRRCARVRIALVSGSDGSGAAIDEACTAAYTLSAACLWERRSRVYYHTRLSEELDTGSVVAEG